MITKAQLLKCSIAKFTKFGSKSVILDDIANELGISKKTIYTFFKNKEGLVTASLESLLNAYKEDINRIVSLNNNDPILSVILIYKRGFEYLKYFKPSFLFGLDKYYPKASKLFEAFNTELANSIVYKLLKEAQVSGSIKPEVDLELVVKIYFFRIDNVVFKNDDLFDLYGKEKLFRHLVVYNLKGITTIKYSNSYFDNL